MITRALTSTNDWQFGNGLNSYLVGEAAIEANIRTKLLEWVGNCYFNLLAGIDWKNRLDVGQQQALLIEIKNLVLNCYGVVAITSISANFNSATRFDAITINLMTIFSRSATIVLAPPVMGTH